MLPPDRMYLLATLQRIEEYRATHDKKFADNPVHKNCMPNFDKAINNLKQELAKIEERSQPAS
jgi:hypothetical protein